jgi:hypothetical protein
MVEVIHDDRNKPKHNRERHETKAPPLSLIRYENHPRQVEKQEN